MQMTEYTGGPFRLGGSTVGRVYFSKEGPRDGYVILCELVFPPVGTFGGRNALCSHLSGTNRRSGPEFSYVEFADGFGPGHFLRLRNVEPIHVSLGNYVCPSVMLCGESRGWDRFDSLAEFMHAWEDMTLPQPRRSRVVTQLEVEE